MLLSRSLKSSYYCRSAGTPASSPSLPSRHVVRCYVHREHQASPMLAVGASLMLASQALFPCTSMAEMMMAAPEPSASYAYTDEEDLKRQEAQFDENLMTPELRELVDVLQTKGSNVKVDELQGLRKKVGFRRAPEGRVSLRAKNGEWYTVRADMQTPGFLLLRNEDNGTVWFLPPDETGRLLQIDLSDDIVVAELFSNGAWYDVKEPLYDAQSGRNSSEPLVMTKGEFADVVSLLEGAIEQ